MTDKTPQDLEQEEIDAMKEKIKAENEEKLRTERIRKEAEKQIAKENTISYAESNRRQWEWMKKNPIKMILILFCTTWFIVYTVAENSGLGYSSSSYSSSSSSSERTSGSCDSAMKKAVADEYKSPSTVKFVSCKWDKSKGIYGEADAENGFGATVRSSFLCNGNSCIITQK